MNQPATASFARRRLWLLDCLVDMRLPVHLFADPHFGLKLNRPAHSLSLPELTDIVRELLISRHIFVTDNETLQTSTRALEIDRALAAAFRKSPVLYVGLTAQGGAEWEAHVKPQWFRYLDYGEDGTTLSASSLSRELVSEFVALADWIDPDVELLTEHGRLCEVTPLVCPYWKVHDLGYRYECPIAYAPETLIANRRERLAADNELSARLQAFRTTVLTYLDGSVLL